MVRVVLGALAFALTLFEAHAAVFTPTIAARESHVLVSRGDGTVAGWGSDNYGKLGTGRAVAQPTPRKIAGLPTIQQVASYSYHTLALDTQGRVWSWGQNDLAQLGVRVQRRSSLPGRVQGISNVIAIAATEVRSFALRSDGTVWYWGEDPFSGALDPSPRPYPGFTGVVQISGGIHHLLARRADGTVVAVGGNQGGQLGAGFNSPITDGPITAPTQTLLPANVVEVTATTQGGLAQTADGKIYEWGISGPNAIQSGVATPRLVNGLPMAVAQLLGGLSAYAVLSDGTVWVWDTETNPVQITGFANIRSAAVDIQQSSVAAVANDGRLFVRSTNRVGEYGNGTLGTTDASQIVEVPTSVRFTAVDLNWNSVLALANNGDLWVWGGDVDGSLADGAVQSYSAPRSIPGVANIIQVATEAQGSVALASDGTVWAWGSNINGQFGNGGSSPSAVPVQIPITGVTAIAAGHGDYLFLRADGSVWCIPCVGDLPGPSNLPRQVPGLPSIRAIAAGAGTAFFIDQAGHLFAMGGNTAGELGDGTTMRRGNPVQVVGIPDPVVQVAAEFRRTMAVTSTGEVWAWGVNSESILGSAPTSVITPFPQKVPNLSDVIAVATGSNNHLALRSDGTLMSWGVDGAALGRDDVAGNPTWHLPKPVQEIDSVIAIAAGRRGAFAIRSDGSVWGWGENYASNLGPAVGDGTLTRRNRPVVVIREGAAGNLDTNDWFLDAKPGTAKTIPLAKVPKVISRSQSLSSAALLNVDASLSVRASDQSKTLGLYVVGLVPPEFLNQVKTVSGTQAKAAGLKAGVPILVNLTPNGWTIAAGQLQAFTTGVSNAFLGAGNILTNLNPAQIPGARFCIGYGESASSMLSTGTMTDFLSLEGAPANALGLPCLLSGVYVDGPRTSAQGSSVPLRALVVGQAPTGTVRFREHLTDLSANVALAPVNLAVSQATFSYQSGAAGEFAFGATYSGDALNAAAVSEVPLRSVVRIVQTATSTRLAGPVSSEIGMEARFVAYITGNRPAGVVQFKRGGVNEGAPVPVVNDQAVRSIVGLALGDHSISAEYAGDSANNPSVSQALVHRVLDVATSAATLSSSANPVVSGNAVTLTVSVTGTNPGGSVTLREDAVALDVATIANGSAIFTVPDLSPGVHVLTADYSGDSSNPRATSNALFQQVSFAPAPNPPRLVNIATRMQVLTGDNVLIGGFIIGGSTPKTVVVRARGPSLIPLGVPNALANPMLSLYSAQTVIASNDDFGTASNVAQLQASGFAPSNALESAILATLNPGPYTAIVSGAGGATGIGIIEVFEVDATTVPLINIATRGQVLTGDNVMIGGFIIQGSGPQTVVVRARGPSLTALGAPNALANPTLSLYSGQAVIASNDDFGTASNLSQLQTSGFAPANALESAILITLNPGAYTAIVSGAAGATGVGIVEVFTFP